MILYIYISIYAILFPFLEYFPCFSDCEYVFLIQYGTQYIVKTSLKLIINIIVMITKKAKKINSI